MNENIISKIKKLAIIQRAIHKEILNKTLSINYENELSKYKQYEKEIS